MRINPADTAWFAEDCSLLDAPMVRGFMVPKAQDADSLTQLAARLRPDQWLIPLVETAAGWFAAQAIARVPRMLRLAFGSVDFMSDSGIQGEGQEMNSVRTQLVRVSRLTGIAAPIDGCRWPSTMPSSLKATCGVRAASASVSSSASIPGSGRRAHRLCADGGRGGVAASVIEALAADPLGAITVDGKMVDKPIALLAQAILAEAA